MTAAIPDWQSKAALLKASAFIDDDWYKNRYADVVILGMDAAEHYLKYGAAMGRNPSEAFDTGFYLQTYPDVGLNNQNPLLHYILHGREEGRYGHPNDRQNPIRRIREARRRIRTLGYETRPLEELKVLAESDDHLVRALSATEIALWHFHKSTPQDYIQSLSYLEKAARYATDASLATRIVVLRLLCLHHLDRRTQGQALFEEALALGLDSPDICLARANLEVRTKDRIHFINRALSKSDIPEIALISGHGTLYDRLTLAEPPVRTPIEGYPKISVLMAAYNAAETLPTALRSLQAQTWQNIEIIVIDDASTDATADIVSHFAHSDPRIILLRLKENGGAYVARNAGLDLASGDYVTLHDADDWSHPLKLEVQARCLNAEPTLIGCTSQQARAQSDLKFLRCTDDGALVFPNTSSLMFRRQPVQEACGYWDTVRFSADNELIRRIRKIFGHLAVRHLDTGPLSFQRHSQTSIVAHPAFGINGSPYGIRQEYFEAQSYHHKNATSLHYNNRPESRPFPVPKAMLALTAKTIPHFDVILASDFRIEENATTAIEAILQLNAACLSVGLVPLYAYDVDPNPHRLMTEPLRARIDGKNVQVLTYGETATCDLLCVPEPDVLQERQTFLPDIRPARVEIIATHRSQTPVFGEILKKANDNIRHYFGCVPVWTSTGSLPTYINDRLEGRKARLSEIFSPSQHHTVFFRKLTTELLPALDEQLISALGQGQQTPPPLPLQQTTLISIIMPTFNRATILADAIQSIRDQIYTHWELFVCDDGSTDTTAQVVEGFSDSRIIYLPLEKGGAAAARNEGLKRAHGTIITYLDSDNYWHPHYLAHVVHEFGSKTGDAEKPLTLYSNYIDYQISAHGPTVIESWERPSFNHERLLEKNYIDLNTFAHHRALYDTFGGFNPALKRRQDYDLILKYTWLQDPIHNPNILALYQRNDQLTQITQAERHDTSCIEIINQSVAAYFRSGLPVQPPRSDSLPTPASAIFDDNTAERALAGHNRQEIRQRIGLRPDDKALLYFGRNNTAFSAAEQTMNPAGYRLIDPSATCLMASEMVYAADAIVLWRHLTRRASNQPLPDVIMCALAAGTVIIGSDENIPEGWVQQGYAHSVASGNWSELLETLKTIFNSSDQLQAKAEATRRLYMRHYSAAAQQARTRLNIHDQCIGNIAQPLSD